VTDDDTLAVDEAADAAVGVLEFLDGAVRDGVARRAVGCGVGHGLRDRMLGERFDRAGAPEQFVGVSVTHTPPIAVVDRVNTLVAAVGHVNALVAVVNRERSRRPSSPS